MATGWFDADTSTLKVSEVEDARVGGWGFVELKTLFHDVKLDAARTQQHISYWAMLQEIRIDVQKHAEQ